ncbi:MAG TPA: DUF1080 domain-containing protein [Solirubrobacter sp.]|nr:DUF1080 domain-containing protein [Solirubrobacter sp.]
MTTGCLAAAALGLAPAAAQAQYQAPPPDPGFTYIFDGTPTGTPASFDKWKFAAGTLTQSNQHPDVGGPPGGQGRATLDTNPDSPTAGAFLMGASPFGAYWYPEKAFGDAVFKIQFTVQPDMDGVVSTRNGGVMIRSPEVRYSCPDPANPEGPRIACPTNNGNAATLALKPTGFNYDLCGAALPLCNLTSPAPSTTYTWAGASGPFPPAGTYTGGYCARQTAAGVYDVNGLNGNPLTVNGNANNHQHWTQVYCGHEIQINESLTGGGPQPSTDPIKTGSVYGFRNLNAKQSGVAERINAGPNGGKGIWHEFEIRTIGQQYTILIDGKLINQFDNSIPKIASRAGDPPTMARQFARGYIGLQTHGGNDRISYREIQVKEFQPSDIPVNTVPPSVKHFGPPGVAYTGKPLTCDHGEWNAPAGATHFTRWYRSNKIPANSPRLRAPSQLDYNNTTTPAEPEHGTQNLTWLDAQVIGTEDTYTPTFEDVGKAIYCAANVDAGGATVWKTAAAPEIQFAAHDDLDVSLDVPATLSLTLGGPATFGAFTPGTTADYDATTTANVISTAGDAKLSVADPSDTNTGQLVNGSFVLPTKLQARAASAAAPGGALADVGGSANPTSLLDYTNPISNDQVTLSFRQHINANDALRTGTYSKTLTFTLSTTQP